MIIKEEVIMKTTFSPFGKNSLKWNVGFDAENLAQLTLKQGTPVTLDYESVWCVRRNRIVGAFRAFVNDIALGAVRGL